MNGFLRTTSSASRAGELRVSAIYIERRPILVAVELFNFLLGEKVKIQFLIGAGASLGAQLPDTSKLTEAVIRKAKNDPEMAYLVKFCERLFAKSKIKFQPNYEDFVNLALHLEEFRDKFNFETHKLLSQAEKYSNKVGITTNFQTVAMKFVEEAKKTIADELFCDFSKAPNRIKYYDPLLQIKKRLGYLDIFTLNHDRSLDEFLRDRFTYEFTNGFEVPGSGKWNSELFDQSKKTVRLFKLHGSLGWIQCTSQNGGISIYDAIDYRFVGKYTDDCWSSVPVFLIGTMRKIGEYSFIPYIELFHRLYDELEKADILLVSGYGFGDYRINQILIDKIYSRFGNLKIVMIYSPDHLPKENLNLCFKTPKTYNDLKNCGVFVEYPKSFEDALADWQHLLGFCWGILKPKITQFHN